MGNQICTQVRRDQQHQNDQVYRFIENSIQSTDIFPKQRIPFIVLDKLKEYQIDIQKIMKGRLREYKQKESYMAYLVYNIQNNQKNQSDVKFNIKTNQKVVLCIFKQHNDHDININNLQIQSHHKNNIQNNHQHNNQQQKQYIFQTLYYGYINQRMKVSDGLLFSSTGQVYQGQLINLQYEGDNGILKSANNQHYYQGRWLNNKPNGQGIQVFQNKYQYQGNFYQGKWQKQGILKIYKKQHNSIQVYEYHGKFINGKIYNKGKIIKQNQLIYQGQFNNSQQHGKGKWYAQNGQYYQGEFIQGKKEGFGIYYFNQFKKYQGEFKNDKPDGQGILYDKNKMYKGLWSNGKNVVIFETQNIQNKQNHNR